MALERMDHYLEAFQDYERSTKRESCEHAALRS